MTTIVIKPKTKEEQDFLTCLFEKMNVDISIVEELVPNYETQKAMKDVHLKKGTKVKGTKDLYTKLGI